MKRHSITLTFIITALAGITLCAQTPDNVKYTFTEASDLTLTGKIFTDTPNPYHRVDTVKYKGFTEVENLLVRESSGIACAFKTNSSTISVATVYGNPVWHSNTNGFASRGYDLYIKQDGKWLWAAAGVAPDKNLEANKVLIQNMEPVEHECLLYLPLYSEVNSVKIGVEEGASIEAIPNPFRHRVVVWGSSFTHGSSTSRAGMTYPAQFSRNTGIQLLSLGCSGHCTLQDYFCEVLCHAENVDAFLFDSFSNGDANSIHERLFPFIEKLQAAQPGVPLIFQQTIRREKRNFNTASEAKEAAKQAMADSLMNIAVKRYKNVYFIKPSATAPDHNATVDGTHPSNYGYQLWAESIEKPVMEILASSLRDPVPSGNFSGKFNIEDVKTVCDAVNDWEIAHFDTGRLSADHWAQGAMYRGMYEWAELTGDEETFRFLKGVAKSVNYRPGRKTYHADHTTVLQTWIKLYQKYGKENMIRPAQERLHWVAGHPSEAPLSKDDKFGKDDRWSWCDALFMAPPAYAQMYALTGEKIYLEYMENEFKACTNSLYDVKERLYFRDCTYFDKREANGKKVFWGRGNGWVFAGIPLILDALPSDYQNAEYFIGIFRDMAERIVVLQDKEGHWHASMLDPESFPLPENSASAFFCYGLAWGLRTGVLEGAKYEKALKKGWSALVEGIHNDGMPGYIQPIGKDPVSADFDATEVYGAGGILLAGSEIIRILGNK